MIWLCLFASVLQPVSAGELKQDKKLVKGKLSNGLTYYIYPNDYPKGEAVYRLFIKSGSVYEDEPQRGLAHFLEHMAFNGIRHFPGDGIVRFLESKGAKFGKDLNAHTSFNETVYKLQLPAHDPGLVDTTLTILADWAGNLLLDSAEIEKERGVIFSEWLSKTGPKNDVQEALLMEILNSSRYSQRIVIGDTGVIKHFPHPLLREYYRTWYRPDLMAVAVAGDVDPAVVEKLIQSKFSYLKTYKKKPARSYTIPDYREEKYLIIHHESLDKVEFMAIQLFNPFPPVRRERDYAVYLQRTLLNRLLKERFNRLSFNHPAYAKASIGISDFLNTKGLFTMSAELIPGKIDAGIQSVTESLEQIRRYGFTSLEIKKEKQRYYNQIKRKAQAKSPTESMNFMNDIYADFFKEYKIVSFDEEFRLLQQYIGQIDSVALVRAINKLIVPQKTHYLITSFDKAVAELPSEARFLSDMKALRNRSLPAYAQHPDIPENLLASEPLPGTIIQRTAIKDIDAEAVALSNGSTVIFKRMSSDRNKMMLTAFREGGLYALDSTDFVSGIFAGSIIPASGAGKFSRDALSYYLAGNTASVRFLIEKTRNGVVGGCDLDDMETMFRLLYLKWMYPVVDNKVYQQAKEKAIDSYRQANKTDADRYYRELSNLLQGENYTNRELSDTIISGELQKDRLLPVFNHAFGSAAGYTFVIIGDCVFDDIKDFVTTYIGSLPSGAPATDYVYRGGTIPRQPLVFDRAAGDSPKAHVSLVFQQDTLDKDFRMYDLEGDIMKAVLRTKLLKKLREDMGMVYSVSVSASATLHPAPLSRQTITFVTQAQQVDLLIDETLNQLRAMQSDPQSFEAELNDVKKNLLKEMSLNKQKNTFWSSFIRNMIFNHETNWRYVDDYAEIVQNITVHDIASVIDNRLLKTPMIRASLYPKESKQKE
jgi:zinc protease